MSKVKKAARRLTVSLIGFPLLLAGIILIPLPGPGLIITFLAALLLATEFEWAQKRVEQAKAEFKKIYKASKDRADRIENWGDKRSKK